MEKLIAFGCSFTFGENLDEAFELAEELENICHQYIITLRVGKPKILSSQEMKNVLNKIDFSPPEVIYSIALKSSLIFSNDTGPGHIASLSNNHMILFQIYLNQIFQNLVLPIVVLQKQSFV